MANILYTALTGISKKLVGLLDGTHAECTVDVTGQAGGTVVTNAASFSGSATNLLVLSDITISAITAPVADPDGQPYWHANLRINADLADIAQALAPTSPAIAAGLADLARWFVVEPDGKATAPKQPERVWL